MAVREALLALLGMGPAYGFALHGGLAERTGGRRAINVGQSYATLERATKAGLITSAGATDDGLPLHRLTASGETVVAGWLSGTDASGADPWDESLDRVLITASLPEVPLSPCSRPNANAGSRGSPLPARRPRTPPRPANSLRRMPRPAPV